MSQTRQAPPAERRCEVCGVVVLRLWPSQRRGELNAEYLDAWGRTRPPVQGYRCKDHAGVA